MGKREHRKPNGLISGGVRGTDDLRPTLGQKPGRILHDPRRHMSNVFVDWSNDGLLGRLRLAGQAEVGNQTKVDWIGWGGYADGLVIGVGSGTVGCADVGPIHGR